MSEWSASFPPPSPVSVIVRIPHVAGRFESRDDVRRVAGSADAQKHGARKAIGFDLTRKDRLERVENFEEYVDLRVSLRLSGQVLRSCWGDKQSHHSHTRAVA